MTKPLYPSVRWPFAQLEWFLGPVLIFREHGIEARTDGLHQEHTNVEEVATHNTVTAALCGVTAHTVSRWKHRGLTDRMADEVAIRLGVHPCAIWRHWFDVVELEEAA